MASNPPLFCPQCMNTTKPATTYFLLCCLTLTKRRNRMLTSLFAERFVALDVHKRYVVIGAVNAQQQIVLAPRRVESRRSPWLESTPSLFH